MPGYIYEIRQKIGHDLLFTPAAGVMAFDAQGRVLLVKDSGSGLWVIPGGAVEPDENPADAACREMWEETGLLVEPLRISGVYSGPDFLVQYPNGDRTMYLSTIFVGRVIGGTLRADGQETLDAAYFSLQEVAALNAPRWVHIMLADAADDSRTHFTPPTWTPPQDDVVHGGISDYVRGLRDTIGSDLLMLPAAGGVVRDAQGRVLLQQRSDNQRWSLPGGAMDPGESPADAVVREVWEETGVLVEPLRVSGVYGGTGLHATYPHGDRIAIYSVVFACRPLHGEPRSDGLESLDVAYLPPDDLRGDLIPERWRWRLWDALEDESPLARFTPPTWQPPQGA